MCYSTMTKIRDSHKRNDKRFVTVKNYFCCVLTTRIEMRRNHYGGGDGKRSKVYKIALILALISTVLWVGTLFNFMTTRSAEASGRSVKARGEDDAAVYASGDATNEVTNNPPIEKATSKPIDNLNNDILETSVQLPPIGVPASPVQLRLLDKDSPRPKYFPQSSFFQEIAKAQPDFSDSKILLISNRNRTRIISASISDLSSPVTIAKRLSYSSLGTSIKLYLPDYKHKSFSPSEASSLFSSVSFSYPIRVIATESSSDHYRRYNGAFVLLLAMGAGNNRNFKDYVDGKSRDMIRCMQSVQRYNALMKVNYPVIVFYSRLPKEVISNFQTAIDETTEVKLKGQSKDIGVEPLVIHWVDVEDFFPPDAWPDDLEVFKTIPFRRDYPIGETCRYTKWWIEYLHMCRFRLVFQWFHPIFNYYDYVIQMDIDASIDKIRTSQLTGQIANDLFSWFEVLNKTFGYYRCESALSGCTNKLASTVDKYVQDNLEGKWDNDMGVWDGVNFWAGFYGWDVKKVQENKEMFKFIDYIDKTGNVYFERWGEQTILPFALSFGAKYNQIFWWGDIDVGHYGQSYTSYRSCGRGFIEPIAAKTLFPNEEN